MQPLSFRRAVQVVLMLAITCAAKLSARGQAEVKSPTTQTELPAPAVAATPVPTPWSDARKLLAVNDYAGADQSLRNALLHAPSSAEGHFLLGFTLLHERKPAEAVAEYMQGAKLKEPGAEELIGFASAQRLLRQYQAAEQSLAAAAKLAPERPLVWYLLGRTQYDEGRWADSERSFASCLRLNPQHVQAETGLGLADEKLERPDAAIAAYRAAIALEETATEKDPQPYLALGMLLRRQGKLADALPLLTMATGSVVPDPLAHQERGLALEQLRRYDEALGEMKTAVYLAPKDQAARFFLGRLFRETGHQAEAAQEFARAAQLTDAPLAASSSQH